MITSLIAAVVSLNSARADDSESMWRLKHELRWDAGIDFNIHSMDLNDDIQTEPRPHPADSGFLHGPTTVDLNDGYSGDFHLGLDYIVGPKPIKLIAGADLIWHPLSLGDEYNKGIYESVQQSSDTRPASQGSFVYLRMVPEPIELCPHAGIELALTDNTFIEALLLFPQWGVEFERGNSRYATWEKTETQSWDGKGSGYSVSLRHNLNRQKDASVSFGIQRKEYEMGDLGDMDLFIISGKYVREI